MLSNYVEEAILNHVFRGIAFPSPADVYLGICVSGAGVPEELEAGTITSEITGYTGDRPTVDFSAPVQNAGDGYIDNSAQVEYTAMDAATVGYGFISDSPTKGAGNVLGIVTLVDSGGLQTTRSVAQDGILRFVPGSLRVRLR